MAGGPVLGLSWGLTWAPDPGPASWPGQPQALCSQQCLIKEPDLAHRLGCSLCLEPHMALEWVQAEEEELEPLETAQCGEPSRPCPMDAVSSAQAPYTITAWHSSGETPGCTQGR